MKVKLGVKWPTLIGDKANDDRFEEPEELVENPRTEQRCNACSEVPLVALVPLAS